jgi:hypothetical protein
MMAPNYVVEYRGFSVAKDKFVICRRGNVWLLIPRAHASSSRRFALKITARSVDATGGIIAMTALASAPVSRRIMMGSAGQEMKINVQISILSLYLVYNYV